MNFKRDGEEFMFVQYSDVQTFNQICSSADHMWIHSIAIQQVIESNTSPWAIKR